MKMTCLRGALSLIALSAALDATPAAAQMSAAERKMIATIDSESERSIALLEKLVNINSGTMNPEGVRRTADAIQPEFEQLGFTVRWVPMAEVKRAGHLIAEHKGSPKGKRLLLIGHLDTVFEPSSGFLTFKREGNMATGPGAGDDKGGDVVIVAALRAMQAAGTLKNANIIVVLTGDEERVATPMTISRRDLIEAADRSDVALDFEGLAREGGKDMGTVARRGSNAWKLTTTGRSTHSSGIFGEGVGYGANFEMVRILDTFRRELHEYGLTYNIGLMSGGATASLDESETVGTASGKKNIVAGTAIAMGDLRALSDDQNAKIQARMQAIVAQHLPRTDAKLQFYDGLPAMPATPGNLAVLASLNGVNRDMGLAEMPPLDPMQRGGGDISVIASRVDSLAGLGTVGKGAHAAGEQVDLTSIPLQAKRSALLMSRLAAEPRGTAAAK
ncbi:M20/M25/M40 family metallo-hydrolase [Sphingobium aquiterrae]|uniref:M20/M25/M40 family metallo-hydrolase n=1 Tax=Sphingobium aquiterrae TaxID=2038656 RepID=UPI00301A5D74